MTWVTAIALAVICFALAVLIFRPGRSVWASLAAALTFGLVGYAVQASPDMASAPKEAAAGPDAGQYDIVGARREFIGDNERSRADAMYQADAYAARGRYSEAATILSGITSANAGDFEAWIALGNALAEHADGVLTAPALYAYNQARMVKPDHVAPSYFLGVSLVRQGRLAEAQQIWRGAYDAAPEGAPGRAALGERLERIDGMLGAMGGLPAQHSAPPTE
ncbi:tetratricopeptide repeat protein [Aurantiacibacter sediminis]|uniref:Cytochrome C biosynthesis protein n=1 Tax=Aurantiacibacter sediminis TaxID=2793064 RepID=A0ABS0N513_9SPHN|nr:cytochrome C biosynthesis protein [Aurantiacibacter sediminis]MBH5322891.1 cytochrome C biosynthesis protein [Aurantiacibacter sediminis]